MPAIPSLPGGTRQRGPLQVLGGPAAVLAVVVCVGAAGYVLIEGWPLDDALWMVFITLSTIGYGEVHPLSDEGRLFTLGYILVSLGLGTLGVRQFATYVADGGLREDLTDRVWRREMGKLNDHFIVVGHGRLGREIVADLEHQGVPCVVVDLVRPEHASQDTLILVGDATRDEVLIEAGLKRARGLAIATPSDAINVYITLTARALAPEIVIVTRIEDEAAAFKARRAGASDVLLPYHLSGSRMARAMIHPRSSSFVDHATLRQHDDLAMVDLELPAGSSMLTTLRALDLRRRFGVVVVAARHGDEALIFAPDPDRPFGAGDALVVVGSPDGVDRMVTEATSVPD